MKHTVTIEPADRSDATARAYAVLRNMAGGGTAHHGLGADWQAALQLLFCSRDTLHSYTRTHVARERGIVVGHVTCVAGSEFAARNAATRRAIALALGASAIARTLFFETLRALRRARLGPVSPNDMHIVSLAVTPTHRRQGVGRRLLDRASELGRDAGHHQLSLDVATSNAAGLTVYERSGFAPASTHRKMQKMIRPIAPAQA